MFGVEMPTTLHLCFIACRPVVFDATGIDVVTKGMKEGLIDLLVAAAAPTSLGARWAAIVA